MAGSAPKSNRPLRTPYRQQKLKAWQPILTAGTMILQFLVSGIIFLAIGVATLVTSMQLQEYQFDYTNCKQVNTNRTCASVLQANPNRPCVCLEPFQLPHDIKAPVHMYYGLSEYYQNFRRYVQSRDDKQLLGYLLHTRYQCEPYRRDPRTRKFYYPCGAIANSIFNDTLRIKYKAYGANKYRDVDLVFGGISWPTERQRKFRHARDGNLSFTIKPPSWPKPVTDIPGGIQNEAFIVWMRTAALPTFRKLYAFVDHRSTEAFRKVLPKGNYVLEVHYRYPVWQFEGQKRLVLSNANWMGSRNLFLGIMYVSVGNLCLSFTIVCCAIHNRFGTKPYHLPKVSAYWEMKQQRKAARVPERAKAPASEKRVPPPPVVQETAKDPSSRPRPAPCRQ